MKRLIIFDLDGTLAESKSPIDVEMAGLLARLLEIVAVAVISGGAWPQFERQFLSRLPPDAGLENLSILPTCGTKFFRFDRGWQELYSEDFGADEKTTIIAALNKALDLSGFRAEKPWGDLIEDRGSQITLSALGQEAPLEAKEKWDPDFRKRKELKELLTSMIPAFAINLGGSTSIDITRQGIDKGYGIRKLRQTLGVEIEDMVFVGDALFPGGNDYPAKQAGVLSIEVRDPRETRQVVEVMIACLEGQDRPSKTPAAIAMTTAPR